MNRKQKTIVLILALVACAFSGGTMIYIYRAFAKQPLAPPLPEFTPLPLPATWTPTAGTPAGAVTLAPTFAIPPTNTAGPICYGPPVMYILAIGADSRQDAYIYGLADAIRIARVEFAPTPKVTVLEIPRDLWVYVPHIADNLNGLDHAKLNQAYLFGQPGDGFHYWDDPSGGPGLLALTLNENFGARSDRYISVNMRTFENVVNAVGGIDLEIGDEETAKQTGLPVGVHHLDGPAALKVARNREEGMFARASNQNLVLCALQDKLVSPEVVTQIPDLIASFRDNVLTDLSPDEITQLACLGMKIQPKNIVFASFPEELFKPSRHTPDPFTHNPNGLFVWDADFEVLRNYVAQFQAGSWPPPADHRKRIHAKELLPMSQFQSIPPLDAAAALKRFGLRASKGLGQNFLQDPAALEKIALAAEIREDDSVLEIGPGLGSLTRYLAVSAREVVAVELDGEILPALRAILSPYPNVRVIQGDILKTQVSELMRTPGYLVAANIPYYITSAVIRHLLESEVKPRRAVLTIQKEVAERICAEAGDLSLLALSVQVYGKPTLVAKIPAGAFYPAPKVDSAILRIDMYDEPLIPRELLGAFFKLIKAGFSQKRKTLRNALASGLHISAQESEALLASAQIEHMRRAETLSIEEWKRLVGGRQSVISDQ